MIRAAGILFIAADGAALFLQRAATSDHAGEWCFPGGGIEAGETPEDAAKRECVEEIGFLPDGDRILWTRRIADGVDFTTFLQRVEEPFIPKLNSEHTAFAWASAQEISDGAARADAEFHEEDHPRAEDGKFGSGGGMSSKGGATSSHQSTKTEDGKRITASGAALPAHIEALKIPPAWTDVTFSPDPKSSLLATGKDSKGRRQAIYSAEFSAKQAAAKFARINELNQKFHYIADQNEGARKSEDPKKAAAADCAKLIMTTGIRPGSEDDTGAEKKAYGATTLEGKHVEVDGDKVTLKFVGKKGVLLNIPVTDPATAAMLRERKDASGDDGQIFPINEKALLDHVHTLDGGGFKTKDFRTLLGTRTAMGEVAKIEAPTSMSDYKKKVMQVAKIVSTKLGNTPTVALQSYINPSVFAEWRVAA